MTTAPQLEAPASAENLLRHEIRLTGIVQGVGFRPFVYNLAVTLGLRGFVSNSAKGVLIEIEGDKQAIQEFLRRLATERPPLACVESITVRHLPARGEAGFRICGSVDNDHESALVSPDIATCNNCRSEMFDPQNRRYLYPFTNCTDCGPRYSIIRQIPYDRPNTTMDAFVMCELCRAEYHDPSNRRFHAQPNACPQCGPGLALVAGDGVFPGAAEFDSRNSGQVIGAVQRSLLAGKILALKGLGGFHLACDARNPAAVSALRQRKRRSDKPFAVMTGSLQMAEQICHLTSVDRELLCCPQAPIVICPARAENGVAPAVAPGNSTLGVMLPSTPLHHLLFSQVPGGPQPVPLLVMTSGNRSEEPIVTSNEEAWSYLCGVADCFLFHDRPIHTRVDDSVARVAGGQPLTLRRSRGWAPRPIELGMAVEHVLACGGELKNTLCLTRDHYAFLSQHIGDLENYETLVFFQETLERMKKLFRIQPRIVAHDLHPRYLSTRLALEMTGLVKMGVQHHHAHIAACMAENRLKEKVIGVAFDGTGYGEDGCIWGGEFLIADFAGYQRAAHFRYVPLAGGDAAVRQPWRAALSYLVDAFGTHWTGLDLSLVRQIPARELELLTTITAKGINSVPTSSCGRLFDGVAAILGLRRDVTFEGQAAIELEMLAVDGVDQRYEFQLAGEPLQVDFRPTIRGIVRDVQLGLAPGLVSAKFHNTISAAIVTVCRRLRRATGVNQVCLSGGTFQNMRLRRLAAAQLQTAGMHVFLHNAVPPNDAGIALGQAVIASHRAGRSC